MSRAVRIAIDFDGTIVEHEYPDIGAPVDGAIGWMRRWQRAGADLILWTMRHGQPLVEAVRYCASKGVTFVGVNEGPGDRKWTQSPKVYAHIYVDDAAFGCPLTPPREPHGRPVADWTVIGPAIMERLNQVR